MLSQAALDREYALEYEDALQRARNGLLSFTVFTKPDYEINWHHRVMCQAMNRLVAGDITRLLITAPPRHGKSEIISRRLPAFVLGRDPNTEIISASYGKGLAQRMNRDVQRIITSPQYREVFPNTRLNEKNIRTVASGTWLRNSEMFQVVGHAGYYLCTGISGGSIVGSGGDLALIDDPCKSWEQAYSAKTRDKVWEWYTSSLYTRLSKCGRICLTLTRWHEDDLAGRILALMAMDPEADQWVHINLPALNEDGPSQYDPRKVGEALWPSRWNVERLNKIRRNSEKVFIANYQNRPAPAEGNIVKKAWWRYYDELPANIDMWAVSMDGTFKDKQKNDYTVIQLWARAGANKYLVHQIRDRMSYIKQRAQLRQMHRDHPHALQFWLEDAALAAALKSDLDSEIPGIILVPVHGSKLARAEAVSPQIQAGNVHLPNPTKVPWVYPYILEWANFPNDKHDDQVDATSQALMKLTDAMTYDWIPSGDTRESPWAPMRVGASVAADDD